MKLETKNTDTACQESGPGTRQVVQMPSDKAMQARQFQLPPNLTFLSVTPGQKELKCDKSSP